MEPKPGKFAKALSQSMEWVCKPGGWEIENEGKEIAEKSASSNLQKFLAESCKETTSKI